MAENGAGGNLEPALKTIAGLISELDGISEDRQSMNDGARAIRDRLQNEFGVPKDVITFVRRYKAWDERKRGQFDMALALVRKSIGMPLQMDLFDNVVIPTKDVLDQQFGEEAAAE